MAMVDVSLTCSGKGPPSRIWNLWSPSQALGHADKEQNMPRVSIGLTVYNSERYLEENIESLLAQTFDDFELIITDNASEDRTQEIALSYSAADRRVRYIRNRMNIGLAGNFNQAFRLSSGEFFKWAAYDDLYAKDFLHRCVEVLDHEPSVVLAHPLIVEIDEHGETTSRSEPGPDLSSADPTIRFARLMRAPFWSTSLFGVVRSDAMLGTRLLTDSIASDHVLLSELVLRGQFYEIATDGLFHRDHPDRRAHKSSFVANAQIIDPHISTNATLLRLRLISLYVSAINRAPIGRSKRLRCYKSVARWLGSRFVARTLGIRAGITNAEPSAVGDEAGTVPQRHTSPQSFLD